MSTTELVLCNGSCGKLLSLAERKPTKRRGKIYFRKWCISCWNRAQRNPRDPEKAQKRKENAKKRNAQWSRKQRTHLNLKQQEKTRIDPDFAHRRTVSVLKARAKPAGHAKHAIREREYHGVNAGKKLVHRLAKHALHKIPGYQTHIYAELSCQGLKIEDMHGRNCENGCNGCWSEDHIIPRSKFNFEIFTELQLCWSLWNVRPYPHRLNISEQDRPKLFGRFSHYSEIVQSIRTYSIVGTEIEILQKVAILVKNGVQTWDELIQALTLSA